VDLLCRCGYGFVDRPFRDCSVLKRGYRVCCRAGNRFCGSRGLLHLRTTVISRASIKSKAKRDERGHYRHNHDPTRVLGDEFHTVFSTWTGFPVVLVTTTGCGSLDAA